MEQKYNPIVRTFNGIRAVLMDALDLPRHAICPEAPLEHLIPVRRRREVWRLLQEQGFLVPELGLTPPALRLGILGVVGGTVAGILFFQSWLGLFLAYPLFWVAHGLSLPFAVHFPTSMRTVGDLVLHLISFKKHKGSGYRWTRNEISFKVRLIIARDLGVEFDKIRPETTWQEMGVD
jgi:hypothetical protein